MDLDDHHPPYDHSHWCERCTALDAVSDAAANDPALAHLAAIEDRQFVSGEGNHTDPPVAFVGEAPGREEDEQARPFVGASGRFLFEVVERFLGLTRDQVWTTNVVKYRPPNNRTPYWRELRAGARHLRRELLIVKPRVVVTLGAAPLSLLSATPITQLHGQSFRLTGSPWIYYPMYHPAFILRQRDLLDTFRADLDGLRRTILIEEFPHGPE